LSLSAPEILGEHHDVSGFCCGRPALDEWLKRQARRNQAGSFTRAGSFTVVMVVHDRGRVAGFYGLSPTAVIPAALPRSVRTGQPPNPLPCLLLGQLATGVAWAGRGVATGLLGHALARSVAGARLIGGRALLVNALDEEAAAFWRRRGFLPSRDDPLILFRSIPDIAASLAAAGC
jgi:GNAT superfamily N-acetyltransferase